MQIDSFQLVNLVSNRVPFLLFDQRIKPQFSENFELMNQVFNESKKLNLKKMLLFLNEKNIDKSHPIVIIHNWDWLAKRSVKKLELMGYMNVCYLSGGTKGLQKYLKELEKP